jgi:HNH endonuclease
VRNPHCTASRRLRHPRAGEPNYVRHPPSLRRLKELLHYEPKTGRWTWRVYRARGARAGQEAGKVEVNKRNPRRMIGIDGVLYLASHLAVLYMTGKWPKLVVDHRNRNSLDDRWENLRLATHSQDKGNQKRSACNTSGFKGVTLVKRLEHLDKPFAARIAGSHLGYFATAIEAHQAYLRAARKYYGAEFVRVE